MMKPILNRAPEEGSGRIESLLLWTLREKGGSPLSNAGTVERFHRRMTRLVREERIKILRTNTKPLGEECDRRRASIAARVRGVLRAGDWVICARRENGALVFDLAYGLEGDQVLLDGERRMPLSAWQQEAECYWLVTLTFPAVEPPFRGAETSRVELIWLQQQLNWVLDAHLPLTGIYTPETQQAVERFRRRIQAKQGGYIEPMEEELAGRLALYQRT